MFLHFRFSISETEQKKHNEIKSIVGLRKIWSKNSLTILPREKRVSFRPNSNVWPPIKSIIYSQFKYRDRNAGA